MSSHANCTHEKTKAARAACRAGKAEPKRLIDPDTLTHMQRVDPITGEPIGPRVRLRKKAASSSEKLSQPKAEGATSSKPATTISGFCGNGTHDRCPGGGKQWHCGCDCHSA